MSPIGTLKIPRLTARDDNSLTARDDNSLTARDDNSLTARDDNQRAFAAWALVAVAVLVGPVLVPIAAGWAVLRLALR